MRRRLELVGHACAAFAVLALVLRLTLRDRVPVIATLFYATPLPIIAMMLAVAAAGWWRRRSVAPLAAAILVMAWAGMPFTRAATVEKPTLRLALWNVAHKGGGTRTRAAISAMNPDIAVMVETGSMGREAIDAWRWPAAISTDGMLVLARTSVVDEGPLDVGAGATVRRFLATSGGTSLRLVVVADVRSNPFLSRRSALVAILREATAIDGPVVLLGDFNTPAASVWFDDYRASFANAFETVGHGWAPTWPAMLPVLQIDHVWTRGVTPLRAEHGWVRGFDHRPVVVDLGGN